MSDVRDDQDVAESVDPDVLPDYDDPAGNLMYPPDVPMGVQEYGTTAAEERVDEPLEERVAREVPDTLDAVGEPGEETIARIEGENIEEYPVMDAALIAELSEPPVLPADRPTFDDAAYWS